MKKAGPRGSGFGTVEKVAKATFSNGAARNFDLDVVVASCGSLASG